MFLLSEVTGKSQPSFTNTLLKILHFPFLRFCYLHVTQSTILPFLHLQYAPIGKCYECKGQYRSVPNKLLKLN